MQYTTTKIKRFAKTLYLMMITMMLTACLASSSTNNSVSTTGRYIDSQRNVDHLYNSVVAFVQVNERTGAQRSYCTGFYVQRDLIASAAHCFERPIPELPIISVPGHVGDTASFRTWFQYGAANDHRGPTNTANIIAIDVDNDVALLRTDTISRDFLRINTATPAVGSVVFAMGQPGGMPWVLSQGTVSQIAREEGNRVVGILASPPVYFGSSGGPLINNLGEVVGVTGAIMFRQPVFGFFYPISMVTGLQPNLFFTNHSNR